MTCPYDATIRGFFNGLSFLGTYRSRKKEMASALETYRSEEHNGPIFLETNKTKPQAV